jgi:hypothetical protein
VLVGGVGVVIIGLVAFLAFRREAR